MSAWEPDPYGPIPSIEEGQLPMYELQDFLKQFPGHPQQLTPHHPNYVANLPEREESA